MELGELAAGFAGSPAQAAELSQVFHVHSSACRMPCLHSFRLAASTYIYILSTSYVDPALTTLQHATRVEPFLGCSCSHSLPIALRPAMILSGVCVGKRWRQSDSTADPGRTLARPALLLLRPRPPPRAPPPRPRRFSGLARIWALSFDPAMPTSTPGSEH